MFMSDLLEEAEKSGLVTDDIGTLTRLEVDIGSVKDSTYVAVGELSIGINFF